jgi:hypothetical protein
MKTYVLTISRTFPSTHSRAGQLTNFESLIDSGVKIHTIRGNYELWRKRFDEINNRNAFLSVREWEGKPYNSKQKELFRFYDVHGIGVEKCYLIDMDRETLAKNDGLTLPDFKEWFKNYGVLTPLAIIHFTKFRYNNIKPFGA